MTEWIKENKKQIVRSQVELNKENAQDLYNELENDTPFCLEKELVCQKFGIENDPPRPKTLEKWILNAIELDKGYSLKVGESSKGYFIFRRID
jgi:hypothetical protein